MRIVLQLLKEIEREKFLLLIVWRITKALFKMPESLLSFDFSRSALERITGDALTGCLVLGCSPRLFLSDCCFTSACAIWIAISRPIEWLGWGPGAFHVKELHKLIDDVLGFLFFSLLFFVHPIIVLGFDIIIPILISVICHIIPSKAAAQVEESCNDVRIGLARADHSTSIVLGAGGGYSYTSEGHSTNDGFASFDFSGMWRYDVGDTVGCAQLIAPVEETDGWGREGLRFAIGGRSPSAVSILNPQEIFEHSGALKEALGDLGVDNNWFKWSERELRESLLESVSMCKLDTPPHFFCRWLLRQVSQSGLNATEASKELSSLYNILERRFSNDTESYQHKALIAKGDELVQRCTNIWFRTAHETILYQMSGHSHEDSKKKRYFELVRSRSEGLSMFTASFVIILVQSGALGNSH
eukprot:752723-Hanusia_phi.AAC.3